MTDFSLPETVLRVEYLPIGSVLLDGTIMYTTTNEEQRAIVREKIREAIEQHSIPITAISYVQARCRVDGPIPQVGAYHGFIDRLRDLINVEILDYGVWYRHEWRHLNRQT
jgi:hypothetical protein